MALIRNASNFTEGLVNGLGQHVAKLDETAWGVNISTCYKYCGSIRFPVSHYCFAGLGGLELCHAFRLQRMKVNEDLQYGKYLNLSAPLFQVIPLICNANRFQFPQICRYFHQLPPALACPDSTTSIRGSRCLQKHYQLLLSCRKSCINNLLPGAYHPEPVLDSEPIPRTFRKSPRSRSEQQI
jgi:hypothetical protein